MKRPAEDAEALDQRERAAGSWALVIHEPSLGAEQLRLVRSVLRVHRRELTDFLARLPGSVRRGARRDLQPLLEALQAAGIAADLVPRDPT